MFALRLLKIDYLSAILLITVLASCERRNSRHMKYAGVYEVYRYELEYLNSEGGIDSVFEYNDMGKIGLYFNNSDAYNNLSIVLDFQPYLWSRYGVGGQLAVGWYTDTYKGETITFWSDGEYYTSFAVYNVKEKAGKKMEWSCVSTDASGHLNLRETLYVKKQ